MGATQIWCQTINDTQTRHITPIAKQRGKMHPKNVVTLLYYASSVDLTMLIALVSIVANQYKSTETTAQYITHMLYYFATHINSTICYKKIDMVICVHSNGY